MIVQVMWFEVTVARVWNIAESLRLRLRAGLEGDRAMQSAIGAIHTVDSLPHQTLTDQQSSIEPSVNDLGGRESQRAANQALSSSQPQCRPRNFSGEPQYDPLMPHQGAEDRQHITSTGPLPARVSSEEGARDQRVDILSSSDPSPVFLSGSLSHSHPSLNNTRRSTTSLPVTIGDGSNTFHESHEAEEVQTAVIQGVEDLESKRGTPDVQALRPIEVGFTDGDDDDGGVSAAALPAWPTLDGEDHLTIASPMAAQPRRPMLPSSSSSSLLGGSSSSSPRRVTISSAPATDEDGQVYLDASYRSEGDRSDFGDSGDQSQQSESQQSGDGDDVEESYQTYESGETGSSAQSGEEGDEYEESLEMSADQRQLNWQA